MIIRRIVENVNVVRREANPARITVRRSSAVVAQRFGVVNVTRVGGMALRRSFVAADYAGGSLLIGSIAAGKTIQLTVVENTTAFDAGYVTVGTAAAQGILLTTGEAGNTANVFIRDNHCCPVATADYRIYFHGSPSVGAGSVTVYYS